MSVLSTLFGRLVSILLSCTESLYVFPVTLLYYFINYVNQFVQKILFIKKKSNYYNYHLHIIIIFANIVISRITNKIIIRVLLGHFLRDEHLRTRNTGWPNALLNCDFRRKGLLLNPDFCLFKYCCRCCWKFFLRSLKRLTSSFSLSVDERHL